MRVARWIVLGVMLGVPLPSIAQPFPNPPVRFVVHFAPGDATHIATRAVAQKLSENRGRTVVVDNRAGAGGSIGAGTR